MTCAVGPSTSVGTPKDPLPGTSKDSSEQSNPNTLNLSRLRLSEGSQISKNISKESLEPTEIHSSSVCNRKRGLPVTQPARTDHSYARTKPGPAKKARTNYGITVSNSSGYDYENVPQSSELDFLITEYQLANPTVMLVQNDDEPKSYDDIANFPDKEKWYQAVEKELQALKTNKTWVLVDRPPNRNIVGCRYTFKLKRNKNGEVSRYKARLVAQGFSQEPGVDFGETFAPVAKMLSLRIILAIAVKYNLIVEQADAVSAFLQANLEEEIFMRTPQGIECSDGKVCKLLKSLYGLKQSP